MFVDGALSDLELGSDITGRASHSDQTEHTGLSRGETERLELKLVGGGRSSRLGSGPPCAGVLQRVSVCLDEVGSRNREEVSFLIGKVSLPTAQRDAKDVLIIAGQCERDLIFDLERGVELSIELGCMKRFGRGDV
jgi:hypothetical protein